MENYMDAIAALQKKVIVCARNVSLVNISVDTLCSHSASTIAL